MYHHFAGKEALFRAVHAEVEAEAQARVVAARDPKRSPIDQIVAMVNGYLDAGASGKVPFRSGTTKIDATNCHVEVWIDGGTLANVKEAVILTTSALDQPRERR